MRYFLIGFMKSGKTTVGKRLSEYLNIPHISLDNLFELKHGSIVNFFKTKGELKFRKEEQKIIYETFYPKNCIISCGGGVVDKWQNMAFVRSRGRVIYLHCELKNLYARNNSLLRPNWKDREYVAGLYSKRLPLYEKFSDLTIDNIDLEVTLERIIEYAQNN